MMYTLLTDIGTPPVTIDKEDSAPTTQCTSTEISESHISLSTDGNWNEDSSSSDTGDMNGGSSGSDDRDMGGSGRDKKREGKRERKRKGEGERKRAREGGKQSRS